MASASGGSGSRQSHRLNSIVTGAEQLITDAGYPAVTFRSVAQAAGVTPGLVQYYFPALDDLFIAVLRGATDRALAGLEEASRTSSQPLRSVWSYATRPQGSALLLEFTALANHREAVRSAIGEGGERVRQALLEIISPLWSAYGLDNQTFPPAAAVFMLSGIPRMIYLEESLGTFTGHSETVALVERFLDRVEPSTPFR